MTRRAIERRDADSGLDGPGAAEITVIHLKGPLREPLDGDLRQTVRALLRRGRRRMVLDLTRVSRMDAAGVGELVRAYNLMRTAHGVLQIVHASAWVRRILQLVGLFDLLSGNGETPTAEPSPLQSRRCSRA